MAELALLRVDAPVATLTLNRPGARNALSIDLLTALHARVDEFAASTGSHVLILTGEGKAFCAGMDLKQVLGDASGAAAHRLLSSLADLCMKVRALPALTIASVNGAAIGGGCGLSTVCDFSVTHADSKMGFPEVDLGVCPAVVAPWLVRRIGAGRARAMLLRGGLMSGQEAYEAGLVSECVAARDELAAATTALAKRVAAGGPGALAATKSLLNTLDGSLDASLSRRAAELSASILATPEARSMLGAKLGM